MHAGGQEFDPPRLHQHLFGVCSDVGKREPISNESEIFESGSDLDLLGSELLDVGFGSGPSHRQMAGAL